MSLGNAREKEDKEMQSKIIIAITNYFSQRDTKDGPFELMSLLISDAEKPKYSHKCSTSSSLILSPEREICIEWIIGRKVAGLHLGYFSFIIANSYPVANHIHTDLLWVYACVSSSHLPLSLCYTSNDLYT